MRKALTSLFIMGVVLGGPLLLIFSTPVAAAPFQQATATADTTGTATTATADTTGTASPATTTTADTTGTATTATADTTGTASPATTRTTSPSTLPQTGGADTGSGNMLLVIAGFILILGLVLSLVGLTTRNDQA